MSTVLHIAQESHWRQAQAEGTYTRSTRGASLEQVGFVHCSRPEQVAKVATAFYTDMTEQLVVLHIDTNVLAQHGVQVVTEPGDPSDPESEQFPHAYGAIPVEAVTRVQLAAFDDTGTFNMGVDAPN